MSIELDNSFTVPVPPDRAWDVLLDVERIAPCMPGATVEEFDGEVVTGRIKIKVGPVSLTYRGTAKFTERDAEARFVVVEASGKETRGAGTASATVRASLEPEPSGEATKVIIHTTMNVTGRPAQFGRGVMVEVGGKLVEKFAENLSQLISGGDGASASTEASAAAPDSGAQDAGASPLGAVAEAGSGAAAPAAGQPAASAAAAPATQSLPAESPLAESSLAESSPVQSSPVQSPPVQSPAVQSSPVQGEDSLNLVSLVGPAILKRVVPVVLAVVVIALVGRRFLRRGERGQKG
jgi:carbon monoxide dehydrogenase subunit G